MAARAVAILLTAAAMAAPAIASEPVLLHAAGSLRTALTEVASAFEATSGRKVQAKYGPSGTLKDDIAGGAHAEVFASANMAHRRRARAARWCCSRATGYARWCGRGSRSMPRPCSTACSPPT
jgi:molybdate transport system substrate-binding protein